MIRKTFTSVLEQMTRGEWIDIIIQEQENRRQKQRKMSFGPDGSIGKSRPIEIQMTSTLKSNLSEQKRDQAIQVSIMKARAISDNKYISKYKDAVKDLHEKLEIENDMTQKLMQDHKEMMDKVDEFDREIEDLSQRIEKSTKTASTTTNSTAKGKALNEVYTLNVSRRAAITQKNIEKSKKPTDIVIENKTKGGFLAEGFHSENDPFCFFC